MYFKIKSNIELLLKINLTSPYNYSRRPLQYILVLENIFNILSTILFTYEYNINYTQRKILHRSYFLIEIVYAKHKRICHCPYIFLATQDLRSRKQMLQDITLQLNNILNIMQMFQYVKLQPCLYISEVARKNRYNVLLFCVRSVISI